MESRIVRLEEQLSYLTAQLDSQSKKLDNICSAMCKLSDDYNRVKGAVGGALMVVSCVGVFVGYLLDFIKGN